MSELKDGGDRPQKLLSRGAVKVRIALASALVLTVGSWLAPQAAPTALSSTPQERATPLLEEQVQPQVVSRPFVGVQEAATQVRAFSVGVVAPPSSQPRSQRDYSQVPQTPPLASGFGVFVSATHILTHRAAVQGRSTTDVWLDGGGTTAARIVGYELSTGLVLLEVEAASDRRPATVAGDEPMPGALTVAVGRSGEREFALPLFVTSVSDHGYTVDSTSGALLPGMPVFTLAGELLAIIGPEDESGRAIPVRGAAGRMVASAAAGERPSSFGLGLQVATDGLIDSFGPDGVVVAEVVPRSPAADADLQVGDVLLNVGEAPVDSVETALQVLRTAAIGAPTRLRVRRGSRVMDIDVVASSAYEVAAHADAAAEPDDGVEARLVLSLAVLEAAAIPGSARVIAVGGRSVTSEAQVQRELRRARRPIPILVRHQQHQFFAAVGPTP